MPGNERLILCGGASDPRESGLPSLRLSLDEKSGNVHLRISDISERLLANIPEAHLDLLEIASYVYAADSASGRGGATDAQMGARWRRKFRFIIPVRLPALWSTEIVSSALVETLGFLSDDEYAFEFQPAYQPGATKEYFEFPTNRGAEFSPDEVILFSGGLDSLAGTVEELVANGKIVALVSHRSATKIVGTQKFLVGQLQERFGADRVRHIPVWAKLDGRLIRETTHRTRSFLFAALGAVTAQLFGRNRVCFFENGIVSLNLPLAAQVVGARATRTTHPQALAGFCRILSAIFGQPFEVDNPFAWMTKADIVGRISGNACGDLIRHSRSCTRVHEMTRLHPHCGRCSQCIDRRFGILAARQAHEDPKEAYKIDLFTGERRAGPDREIALAYVRTATMVNRMTDVSFYSEFGEASRVVRHFREPAGVAASRIFDLHKRHAAAICHAVDEATGNHAAALRQGDLPGDCLLALTVGRELAVVPYPEPDIIPLPASTPERDIRIAIDAERKCVVFDGWGEIRGVGGAVLVALAASFRQALLAEKAPGNYPFIKAGTLMKQTGCGSDELLRQRVMRCRNAITKLAMNAGGSPLPIDAVIENSQWYGYRLNPDRIRLVAIEELSESD
jgi:hypothetical protein